VPGGGGNPCWDAERPKPTGQWQEAQLPLLQPEHDEALEPMRLLAAPLAPPLLNPHTDISRSVRTQPQSGQLTASSERNTRVSNCFWQSQHWYS